MAIRAVVFDIGGVLEITPDLGIFAGWEQRWVMNPGDLSERTDDIWNLGALGRIDIDAVHARLAERLQLVAGEIDRFMEDMWRQYLGTANTELIAFVRALRPRYRTGILSNSFVGAREREQAAYGFEDLVDEIVYSHEAGLAKPDPAVYALTCERLGCAPSEVVFIDDTPVAVEGALAAGLHAVRFETNLQAIAGIERLLSTSD